MEKEEFLKYCKYYHGEKENPYYKAGEDIKGNFWHGEKILADSFPQNNFDEVWVKIAKTVKPNLKGDKLAFANKYSDIQFAIIIFIEELFKKWCPYDENFDWIFEY